MSFDHGVLNIPGRLRGLDAEIDRNMRRIRAEERAQAQEAKERRKEARQAEIDRPKLQKADIDGARVVRDRDGSLYEVIRVNAKTVTVQAYGAGPFELRIAFDRIVAVGR